MHVWCLRFVMSFLGVGMGYPGGTPSYRRALVDLKGHARLGGGRCWKKSRVMYTRQHAGYWVANSQDVMNYTGNLSFSCYSIERQGYAALGLDWVLLDESDIHVGISTVVAHYDLLFVVPTVLPLLKKALLHEANFRAKVIVYMDEPPDTTTLKEYTHRVGSTLVQTILARSSKLRFCSRCVWSHFFTGDSDQINRYFPPIYDRLLFEMLHKSLSNQCAESDSCRTVFLQKRSVHTKAILEGMRQLGYQAVGTEAWGKRTYFDYYKKMRQARWVIALDPALSAGQVVAEAALLGIPTIAFATKPNARLLLPRHLLVPPNTSAADHVSFVKNVVSTYDSGRRSYAKLSRSLKDTAQERLCVKSAERFMSMLSSCC